MAVVAVMFSSVFVCLVYLHYILKTDARITKHDMLTFHYESWKPIYSGVKR